MPWLVRGRAGSLERVSACSGFGLASFNDAILQMDDEFSLLFTLRCCCSCWRYGSVFSPRYRRYYNLIVMDVSVLVASVRLAKLSIDAIISQ